MTGFRDEDLVAWLDGIADYDLAARIEAVLDDPHVAAQVAALEMPHAALKAGFDGLLAAAPAYSAPAPVVVPQRRGVPIWGTIAASVAAFALGVGLTWTQTRPAPLKWTEMAAIYQSFYAAETLDGLEPDMAAERARLTAMGESLGVDLSIFAELSGLT